jgi:3-oxoacyl-[acyl-carrier-protein] synthase II
VSIHCGIRGPAAALASGLTAGVEALAASARELASGRADRVLAGAAEVATPLLERLTDRALIDGAAAFLVEHEPAARERGATVLARLRATASAFASGDPAAALRRAVRRVLDESSTEPARITRLIASPDDVAIVRALGLAAEVAYEASETLAAAPLISLARQLRSRAPTLLAATDPEGAAAVALLD